MSNEKQQAKDQVQADENAKRAAVVSEAQRREQARIQDEMERAAKGADPDGHEEHVPGTNLTEYHMRAFLANHLAQQVGYEPAKAREIAKTRAAQMINPEAEELHRQRVAREEARARGGRHAAVS